MYSVHVFYKTRNTGARDLKKRCLRVLVGLRFTDGMGSDSDQHNALLARPPEVVPHEIVSALQLTGDAQRPMMCFLHIRSYYSLAPGTYHDTCKLYLCRRGNVAVRLLAKSTKVIFRSPIVQHQPCYMLMYMHNCA